MTAPFFRPAFMVAIGNFLFTTRNKVFPALYLVLFVLFTPDPRFILPGLLVAATGQLLRAAVIGFAYIKRGGVNKKVYADTLVTEGFFAVCRNPLYVGNLLIILGLLLIHGNTVCILAGMALFLFIYQCIVYAEETYLHEKFKDDYEAYCREVPRWMLYFSRLKPATRGMEFNLSRVIMKDYSTCANWLMWTVILLVLHHYHEGLTLNSRNNLLGCRFARGNRFIRAPHPLAEEKADSGGIAGAPLIVFD